VARACDSSINFRDNAMPATRTTRKRQARLASPARREARNETMARAVPPPVRARSRAAATAELDARIDAIEDSIAVLRRAIDTLESMPRERVSALQEAERRARVHAISDAFLAIDDLENAKLQALNAAFEERRPQLHAATRALGQQLDELQDAVAIIGAAAAAVGIVADVISVLA
jgi:hypothetical protein